MATRTTCPYCGVGCGVLATPEGGIAGDPDHPANAGRLCSKGTALGETQGREGRLLHPEIGGQRVSWDAALDHVAGGFRRILDQHGPGAVALYVSGQLLTEDYYAANKLAKAVLGTANIDSNSRLCMASAVAAHRRSFGEDLVPGIYADMEQADLLVLVGSNLAWCHPVLHQRVEAARRARPAMRVVVVDPRRTATCEGGVLHLPLRPGTDVVLFTGLLRHLHGLGHAWPGAAEAAAHGLDLPGTAEACGLNPAAVAEFFDLFAATPRTVTAWSQGVNQSSAGTDKANAIINCHLVTGRIGLPGAGPFSITGQPNAMGGREVGALSNMLAAHLDWDRPGDVALLSEYWRTDRLPPKPGLKAVDLMRAVGRGEVRALWVMGTNPLVSLPEADVVRAALARCDLLVVSECVASDTLDLAHVRLPALGWGEKDGTVTNSERVISRQRAFLPPPGEARQDWQAVAGIASRLGRADGFAWRNSADIFREHAALSGHGNAGARAFDISALAGLTDAEYDALEPTRWPCPAGKPATDRLVVGGIGPNGPARLVPTPLRPPVQQAGGAFPLVLMTGRVRDQWHTMTRTGRTPRLFAHWPEPTLEVHPTDAAGLPDGSVARVSSAEGTALLRVKHENGIKPGSVFVPMHWTRRFCPSGRVNPTVGAATDPVSGQPELKHMPVRLDPFPARWHGFLLARAEPPADLAEWCALVPLGRDGQTTAWRAELAGTDIPDDAAARIQAWAAGPGAWLRLSDPATGVLRLARVDSGRLDACLFMGPDHLLPPRDWLAGLALAPALTLDDRRTLLAGRPATGPAPEPSLCVCHGVGAGVITAAIRDGCGSVDAVGARTKAGTGCGSCRPEISRLLATARIPEPA